MKLQPRAIAVLVLLLCAFNPSRADETDDYIKAQMTKRHIPGLALAVIRDGKVVKMRGYGLASVELSVPVTTDTVFEIGSISKQMTAAAIMLLVEDGKVALDDKLSKHLPGIPEAWRNVTLRHLLTHTSGIKNYTGLAGFELSKKLKRDEFIKAVAAFPLDFSPGDSWSYSNTGYNLLGHTIEVVSDKSYWEFVAERIFKPLDMSATRNRDPKYIISNRAIGYEWQDDALQGRDYDLTDVFSAGAIVSTVADLVRWEAALSTNRLLKTSSLDAVWSPVKLNNGHTRTYGLGWNIETLRSHRLYRHNGQTAGFAATIARYVDDRVSIIILCNLGDLGLAGEIGRGVAKIYIPSLSLRALPVRSDTDMQMTRRLEALLRDRIAGRMPDANMLTSEAQAALNSNGAKKLNQQLASYGALQSFTFIETDNTNNERVNRYKAVIGRHALLFKFVMTKEGKIASMVLEEEEES